MAKREIVAVFLVTHDVDGLVPFYRDVLGLSLTRHDPGHSAWFDAGPLPLVLHKPESEERRGVDYTPDTPILLWLRPEEGVATLVGQLEQLTAGLEKPKDARNYAYVRDPEGRVLGLHDPAGEERTG